MTEIERKPIGANLGRSDDPRIWNPFSDVQSERDAGRLQTENESLRRQLRGAVEALYTAHDFIGRVSKWTGDTEDEQAEVLAEIARHLPQGGGRR